MRQARVHPGTERNLLNAGERNRNVQRGEPCCLRRVDDPKFVLVLKGMPFQKWKGGDFELCFADFAQRHIRHGMHVYVRVLAHHSQKFLAVELNAYWCENAPMMVPFIRLHQTDSENRLESAFFLVLREVIRIVLVVP